MLNKVLSDKCNLLTNCLYNLPKVFISIKNLHLKNEMLKHLLTKMFSTDAMQISLMAGRYPLEIAQSPSKPDTILQGRILE